MGAVGTNFSPRPELITRGVFMVGPFLKVWQCALVGVGPKGEAIVNTFHYGAVVDTVTVDPADVVTEFGVVIPPLFVSLVTDDWTGFMIHALCVKGIDLGQSASAPCVVGVGTLGAGSGPLPVTIIGRRQSEFVGRKSRGRLFISPVLATMVDVDGGVTYPAGYTTTLHSVMLSPLALGPVTLDPVLWCHATHSGYKIVSASESAQCGQVRRRRLRLPN